MGTDSAKAFVVWALSHARPDLIPNGVLAASLDRCGVDPWECLLGTRGQKCTDQLLAERYMAVYSGMGWGAIAFETITYDWVDRSVSVCDGPGLLNAYLANVLDRPSNMTPHGIFSRLCDDRAHLQETNRAFEIGEALFQANCYGVMKRVGWVCGFDIHGEPLIIEARGVAYGICVERMGQGWTHRARMHLEINKEDTDER